MVHSLGTVPDKWGRSRRRAVHRAYGANINTTLASLFGSGAFLRLAGAFYNTPWYWGNFKRVKMKKAIAAVALAGLAAISHAAGTYDGIYQLRAAPNDWISVHSNGSSAVVTHYTILPATGIRVTSIVGAVLPSQINMWDLLLGSWSGSTLNVSGQMMNTACAVSASVVFNATTATVTFTDSSNTALGNAYSTQCQILKGATVSYDRLF